MVDNSGKCVFVLISMLGRKEYLIFFLFTKKHTKKAECIWLMIESSNWSVALKRESPPFC